MRPSINVSSLHSFLQGQCTSRGIRRILQIFMFLSVEQESIPIQWNSICKITHTALFFDAGMSIDGDLQGVPRILDALSAHMWPGLVMKSTEKLTNVQPDSIENDEGANGLHAQCRFSFLVAVKLVV